MSDGIVYVVDDDASVRRALARLISSTGLDVETFPSARALVEQPRPDRPACLVLRPKASSRDRARRPEWSGR